ncbi:MAG: flavin reductase family protein [candidate division Zixibacteria bacterium]|nr:flavin reductase family protein [candidate division Zixibacteria bacterium]
MAKTLIKPDGFMVPLPATLLSCQKPGETPNIITLSWVGVLCSEPPLIGVGIRPGRYSYGIVKETGEFVINVPNEDQVAASDYCGHVSGRKKDKFAECSLTAEKGSVVSAPIIKECPINIECRVTQSIVLGSHELFIGEIVAIQVDENCLNDKGHVDIGKVKPFVYIPGSSEYVGGFDNLLGRGGFAAKKRTMQ